MGCLSVYDWAGPQAGDQSTGWRRAGEQGQWRAAGVGTSGDHSTLQSGGLVGT